MENMKHIILRNVKIIDTRSIHHNQKKDILIENGIIKEIEKNINLKSPFFETKIKNLHVSPGWLDLHARFGEPGFEYRENIESGLNAAAKGGFTGVVVMPSTDPPIETKTDILFLQKKASSHIVDIMPTGCITKKCEQEELTEMYEMHLNGAVAFTDDKKTISNTMLINNALEYVKSFNGLIMNSCLDPYLNEFGQINEGVISTKMGLSPSPELAEDLMISRDLSLLRYTQSKLHLSTISTKNALKKIKKAKNEKLNISSDVAAHNLILNDTVFNNFNSDFKVMPPLRGETTRLSLIKAIVNGTIDAVSSDHTPIEIESKKCEFQEAKFGMIGLETVFPIINTVLKDKLELEKIIDLISVNPRKIIHQKIPKIEINEEANITMFDPNKEWTYKESDIVSISKNTPFINYKFIGKPLGIINKRGILMNR
ncbi:MAG: dihydroorotase [Flavobacteriales bacterium]|nr:dihydroorotase [Flavobacteriales bacterium]